MERRTARGSTTGQARKTPCRRMPRCEGLRSSSPRARPLWKQAVYVKLGLRSHVDFAVCHCWYRELHGEASGITGRNRRAVVYLVRKIGRIEGTKNSRSVRGRWCSQRTSRVNQPNDGVVCPVRGDDGCGAPRAQRLRRLRSKRGWIEDASGHGELL